MLPNERFALDCLAYYEEEGLVVDASNGEFAHCPLPERYGDSGYYLLHGHHQHQGLLQSRDIGECCFFVGHTKKWLQVVDYWPDNYFELWDIHEKYASEHNSKNGKKSVETQRKKGTGIFDPEVRKKNAKNQMENRVGIFGMTQEQRAENSKKGISTQIKGKTGIFDPEVHAKGRATQRKMGVGFFGLTREERVNLGRKSSSQVWESTEDGFRSTASGVSRHNKKRGWDPGARIRVS